MKLMSKAKEGMARIDFDPNRVQNDKFEEIYRYFQSLAKTSKVVWEDDPLHLKRGVVIGYYNQYICTDKMAELACQKAADYIKSCERNVD